VILVLQNTASGYKVIGVGKVVNIESQGTVEKVAVLLISVRGEPIIGKTLANPINQAVFSQSAIGRLSFTIGMVSGVSQKY
jgi:hypothetical protein